MKILTLSIKRIYFDEILSGKKSVESRDIKPTNDYKHVEYHDLSTDTKYKSWKEIPLEGGDIEILPLQYDAIRLFTGAYKGKRPSCLVEVLGAEVIFLVDENSDQIYYDANGLEFPAVAVDYQLGAILGE